MDRQHGTVYPTTKFEGWGVGVGGVYNKTGNEAWQRLFSFATLFGGSSEGTTILEMKPDTDSAYSFATVFGSSSKGTTVPETKPDTDSLFNLETNNFDWVASLESKAIPLNFYFKLIDLQGEVTRVLWMWILFVCVEVLRPSQPNGVMSSAVSLPNHMFTGQA